MTSGDSCLSRSPEIRKQTWEEFFLPCYKSNGCDCPIRRAGFVDLPKAGVLAAKLSR